MPSAPAESMESRDAASEFATNRGLADLINLL
jgi:hypothetical protein